MFIGKKALIFVNMKALHTVYLLVYLFSAALLGHLEGKVTDPHRDPSKCEVCKFVANELQETMAETGKTSDVLKIGHRIDMPKREVKYKHSELRLLETLDEVCPKILKYNIHAERQSSRRFAKGTSETMSTLHGLVHKGVKVELGIPYQMWDEPSAAVTKMKQYCDTLVESHEETIENWFFKTNQEKPLSEYLCRERALTKDDLGCLDEVWTGNEKVDYTKEAEEEREEEEKEEKLKEERKKEREKRRKEEERKKKKQQQKGRKGEEDDLDIEEEIRRRKEKRRREYERRRREEEEEDRRRRRREREHEEMLERRRKKEL